MYDITKAVTYENVERWLKELRDHADSNIGMEWLLGRPLCPHTETIQYRFSTVSYCTMQYCTVLLQPRLVELRGHADPSIGFRETSDLRNKQMCGNFLGVFVTS